MDPWFTLAGIAIASGLSFLAARYSGRSAVKAKTVEVEADAYERADAINAKILQNMEAELERLTKQVDSQGKQVDSQGKNIAELKREVEEITRIFKVAINYIEQDLQWEKDGGRGERPDIPPALVKYIDPKLIRQHEQQSGSSAG